MTKVLIEVSGGCIRNIISNDDIQYLIVDFDNIEAGDEISEDFNFQDVLMSEESMKDYLSKLRNVALKLK